MSEEQLNQELSTDELKDVAGGKGSYTKCATGEHIYKVKDALIKGDLPLEGEPMIGKKGRYTDKGATCND